MEFRWVAAITLWTFLIGPILDASGAQQKSQVIHRPAQAFAIAKSRADREPIGFGFPQDPSRRLLENSPQNA
jgi:hypothetical protein